MYAITGASGHFGRLAVLALIDRGVPADQIAALVRTPAKVADLAERGVVVREADYSRPDTLAPALAGIDDLLLVSGSEVGQRLPQHTAVIEAAQAAGVSRVVYTSIFGADTSTGSLAPEHVATEKLLTDSGLRVTFLRNAWYFENYLGQVGQWLASGQIFSSVGDRAFGAAARSDYADAAAAVLVGQGHDGRTYELAGGPITMAGIADAVTRISGTQVALRTVTDDDLRGGLISAGIPDGFADLLVDIDRTTRIGEMSNDTGDLVRLVGRPLVTLDEAVQVAVTAQAS